MGFVGVLMAKAGLAQLCQSCGEEKTGAYKGVCRNCYQREYLKRKR